MLSRMVMSTLPRFSSQTKRQVEQTVLQQNSIRHLCLCSRQNTFKCWMDFFSPFQLLAFKPLSLMERSSVWWQNIKITSEKFPSLQREPQQNSPCLSSTDHMSYWKRVLRLLYHIPPARWTHTNTLCSFLLVQVGSGQAFYERKGKSHENSCMLHIPKLLFHSNHRSLSCASGWPAHSFASLGISAGQGLDRF